MPSASHDQIEPQEIAPGYSSRFTDWGGITVAFEKAHAGQDASAMVRGLPDDRCQAPHWGYLFSGKIVVHFDDHSETIEGGQAYYIAPGHAIEFLEDSEALEFTPTAALEETFAAVRRNSAAGRQLVMWPVMLPGSWVASTKRCKDAGSAHSGAMGATEDAAARRVIAGQGPGERCRLHH